MKSIELSDAQYETLVKLTFIGEWILNAQHVKPEFKEERECLNVIFSHCEKFNLKKYFNKFGDEWEMDEETVLGIVPIIDQYSKNDFWPNLIHDLAERDAMEDIFYNEKHDIEEDEIESLMEKFSEQYANEFQKNGIANLKVINVENN